MKKNDAYNNQSITSLKGADRVRKRPAVIFGSDGLEGCEHSVFEILSNSVDEAREGYGKIINITAYRDKSVEIEDFGRGVPLGWNETVSFTPAENTTITPTERLTNILSD